MTASPAHRGRRLLLRSALVLVVLLLVDQLLSRLVLGDGYLRGRRVAPFDPPLFHPAQFRLLERLEERAGTAEDEPEPFQGELAFDPDLGWCPRPGAGAGGDRYDLSLIHI